MTISSIRRRALGLICTCSVIKLSTVLVGFVLMEMLVLPYLAHALHVGHTSRQALEFVRLVSMSVSISVLIGNVVSSVLFTFAYRTLARVDLKYRVLCLLTALLVPAYITRLLAPVMVIVECLREGYMPLSSWLVAMSTIALAMYTAGLVGLVLGLWRVGSDLGSPGIEVAAILILISYILNFSLIVLQILSVQ